MKLAVVTASVDPQKTKAGWSSWRPAAGGARAGYLGIAVLNGAAPEARMPGFDVVVRMPEICGVVPAFLAGIREAVSFGADLIACFHDDLRIDQEGWAGLVDKHFARHPRCGLACFSGADGLGADDIYRVPYSPMQLARQGFFSNLEDAEAHGRREPEPRRSACGDGFSQIGRAELMLRWYERLNKKGVVFHFYDSFLGGLCAGAGWECWYLPVRCKHFGGLTAVANTDYQAWAKRQNAEGDAGFWKHSHQVGYESLRDVLPLRVKP